MSLDPTETPDVYAVGEWRCPTCQMAWRVGDGSSEWATIRAICHCGTSVEVGRRP
jgi:hypothetical protein